MSDEMDILGFDPSQLTVFSQNKGQTKANVNKNVYVARPADSKSEDGVYRAKIKVIYSPQNIKNSVLELQSYAMQDENGFFEAISGLTIGDNHDPIFMAWKKCRYSDEGSVLWKQQAKKEDGGKQLFDKRFARYVTIQVLEDKNQPELEGKYMLWKLPRSIWDMIDKKQNPAKESGKCPIPVMDFLFGYAIELEVHPGPDDKNNPQRKTREITYSGEFTEDPESCTYPDGKPLLDDDEQEVLDKYVSKMKKVWREKDVERRAELLNEVNADPNTLELRKIYKNVLDTIKTFCPDLNEELGYKPWDEALTKRVQAWIDVVLSGNEPKTAQAAPADAKAEQSNVADTPAPETAASGNGDDDDLPF